MRWTTPPPCDGVERTVRPEDGELERLDRNGSIRAEVVRVLGDELGHHGGARIADALERRDRILAVHARRVAVDAATAFVAQEDSLEDRVEERARLVAHEPLARKGDRRLDEVAPLTRREASVDLLEAREQPGDRDRPLADVEHLRPGVAEVDEELLHLAEADARDGEEAVEHRRLAGRLVHEREAASGGSRERPLRDEGGEGGGEERVDRVSAFAQHAVRPPRPKAGGRLRSRLASGEATAERYPVFRKDGSSGSSSGAAPESFRTRADRPAGACRRGRSRRPSPRPGRSDADRRSRRR